MGTGCLTVTITHRCATTAFPAPPCATPSARSCPQTLRLYPGCSGTVPDRPFHGARPAGIYAGLPLHRRAADKAYPGSQGLLADQYGAGSRVFRRHPTSCRPLRTSLSRFFPHRQAGRSPQHTGTAGNRRSDMGILTGVLIFPCRCDPIKANHYPAEKPPGSQPELILPAAETYRQTKRPAG